MLERRLLRSRCRNALDIRRANCRAVSVVAKHSNIISACYLFSNNIFWHSYQSSAFDAI